MDVSRICTNIALSCDGKNELPRTNLKWATCYRSPHSRCIWRHSIWTEMMASTDNVRVAEGDSGTADDGCLLERKSRVFRPRNQSCVCWTWDTVSWLPTAELLSPRVGETNAAKTGGWTQTIAKFAKSSLRTGKNCEIIKPTHWLTSSPTRTDSLSVSLYECSIQTFAYP